MKSRSTRLAHALGAATLSLTVTLAPVLPALAASATLTGCASQAQLSEMRVALEDRVATVERYESRIAAGETLTSEEERDLILARADVASIRKTIELSDPATGGSTLAAWALRLISGDVTAIGEGAVGAASAWAGWKATKAAKSARDRRKARVGGSATGGGDASSPATPGMTGPGIGSTEGAPGAGPVPNPANELEALTAELRAAAGESATDRGTGGGL